MKLQFTDVGRDKRSFSIDVRDFDDPKVFKALRSKGGLMSRDIDIVSERDEQGHGSVVVGGFRPVGTWRRVEDAP